MLGEHLLFCVTIGVAIGVPITVPIGCAICLPPDLTTLVCLPIEVLCSTEDTGLKLSCQGSEQLNHMPRAAITCSLEFRTALQRIQPPVNSSITLKKSRQTYRQAEMQARHESDV